MLFDERKSVQRGQASRAPSVFDAQLTSDASHKLRGSSLHWQRATQKEQAPGLHRFNVGAEWGWGTRQVYAKVFQPLLGASARCVRGHSRFPMDITRGLFRSPKRDACLRSSPATTSPPTQMRAAVNVQHLAGDLARLGEIEHRLCDVLGLRNLP